MRVIRRRAPSPIVIILAVLVSGICIWWAIGTSTTPRAGSCLSDLDKSFFTGWHMVGCGDPEAAYKVVATASNVDGDTCADHPEGTRIQRTTGKSGDGHWEMCAVPLG